MAGFEGCRSLEGCRNRLNLYALHAEDWTQGAQIAGYERDDVSGFRVLR